MNYISEKSFDYIKERNRKNYIELIKNRDIDGKVLKKDEEFVLGFYFTVLTTRHNMSTDDAFECITDTRFNDIFRDSPDKDMGIDSIVIDEENKSIHLYNFKYKQEFDNRSSIEGNVFKDIIPFLTTLNSLVAKSKSGNGISAEINSLGKSFGKKVQELVSVLVDPSNKNYKITLILVSNASNELAIQISDEDSILSSNVSEIQQLTLSDIYIDTIVNPDISANIRLDKSSFYIHKDNRTKKKSFVTELSLDTIARITSDNEVLRNDADFAFVNEKPDFNHLSLGSNIRGFIKQSNYVDSIKKTIKNTPYAFYYYNNGITILADEIVEVSINYDSIDYQLVNFQIVNGGQTVRSVFEFIHENENWVESLSNAKIALKIIHLNEKMISSSKIAEYTNSQNPVTNIDLRSNDDVQIRIQEFLEINNIGYLRKNGDVNYDISPYEYITTMTNLGQMLYSHFGNPHKASNTRSKIFGVEYNNLFNVDNIEELALKLVNLYRDIEEYYKSTSYDYSRQKNFYIIYILNFSKRKIKSAVDVLERYVESFVDVENPNLPNSRKLIKSNFKEKFDIEVLRRNGVDV